MQAEIDALDEEERRAEEERRGKIESYTKLLKIVDDSNNFIPVGNNDEELLQSIETRLKHKLKIRSSNTIRRFAGNNESSNYIEQYSQLVDDYFNSDYETFCGRYDNYLNDIGLATDVKESLLNLYSQKIYKAAPPPAMVLFRRSERGVLIGSNGGNNAYQSNGVVFLCENSNDWSGSKEAAAHEVGHYFDSNVIRGKDYFNGNAQNKITESTQIIKNRLNINGAKFRLFDREFTLSEWKSCFQLNPRTSNNMIVPHLYEWLSREIEDRYGFVVGSNKNQNIFVMITDTLQSVFGFPYGFGHDITYCRTANNTYIEAVANITSMITHGYAFIRETLPELYDAIFEEIT